MRPLITIAKAAALVAIKGVKSEKAVYSPFKNSFI